MSDYLYRCLSNAKFNLADANMFPVFTYKKRSHCGFVDKPGGRGFSVVVGVVINLIYFSPAR